MSRKGLIFIFVMLAAILICIAGGFWYYKTHRSAFGIGNLFPRGATPLQQNASSASSTPFNFDHVTAHYSVLLADDQKSISITNVQNGSLIAVITVAEIPSFDNAPGNGGSEILADPASDYLFDYENNGIVIDDLQGIVYFSAYNNKTLSGDGNADRALFSYEISSRKVSLLRSETSSESFAELYLSPDDRFLVYPDATNAGSCNSVANLGIYDIKNKKEIFNDNQLDPSGDAVGADEFDHWVTTSSFAYNEMSYPDGEACMNDDGNNQIVVQKTYTIK